VLGLLLIFLFNISTCAQQYYCIRDSEALVFLASLCALTLRVGAKANKGAGKLKGHALPARFLGFNRNLQVNATGLYLDVSIVTMQACGRMWQRRRPLFRRSNGIGFCSCLPKSLMFITPAALELALLWPFSFGGDDDRPWTAESTLESGSVMLAVVCAYQVVFLTS
jgi:hypothetical protein